MIATGINAAGYREILGLRLGDSESEASWADLFSWLKGRGLHGVDLVTSDSHAGLVRAVQTPFQGVSWQRCQAHCTRNIIDAPPKALHKERAARLRALFSAADPFSARALLQAMHATFAPPAPKALDLLEEGYEDATAVFALPAAYRVRLRTTNSAERLNEEMRRRERVIRIFPSRHSVIRIFPSRHSVIRIFPSRHSVIRIFPSRHSVLRLLGALLMEIEEQWTTSHRYLTMDAYWLWKHQQQQALKGGTATSSAA